ncbi:MAG: energy-coupling factor ABC transporter ATP-binding protein [Nitrososphaeria archaeon]
MIQVNDIYFSYDDYPVLNGISFEVKKGEVLAIVGANGSGKTTLLKHLNGILKPTRGSVKIFGADTKATKISELSRRVGLVMQNSDHQLFASSVTDEISFGLKNFGFSKIEIEQQTKEVLYEFGLYEFKDRPPLSLSGGEKKRLCIAAVMAWKPEIIMLDEPTVGQDAVNKKNLREIIKRLAISGRIVIISTHDLEFLWPINPRTVIISRGKVLIDGNLRSISFNNAVFASANLIAPQLASLASGIGFNEPPADEVHAVEMIKQWQKA